MVINWRIEKEEEIMLSVSQATWKTFRIIAVFLTVFVLLTCSVFLTVPVQAAGTNNSSYIDAYLEVLKKDSTAIVRMETYSNHHHLLSGTVAIADVCGDSTPELLYFKSEAGGWTEDYDFYPAFLSIWTYSSGEAKEILNICVGDWNVWYYCKVFVTNDNSLYVYNPHGQEYNYYTYEKYGLQNERLNVVDEFAWDNYGANNKISKIEYEMLEQGITSSIQRIFLESYNMLEERAQELYSATAAFEHNKMTYNQAVTYLDSLRNSNMTMVESYRVAEPTNSSVLVNGRDMTFDAYAIDGNNYFKLRDLAYVFNGTEKQFEVGWNESLNAIYLTSGRPYTTVGGEMTDKRSGSTGSKTPLLTSSKIFLDGKEVAFTAYNIDGNNYFKLRDIGAALNFGVDWDGARNTIEISTSKGYTAE